MPVAGQAPLFHDKQKSFIHGIYCHPGLQAHFRALHDLPAGEEITQSYFPLHVGYKERQQRLQEDYGFTCTCPRCHVCTRLVSCRESCLLPCSCII